MAKPTMAGISGELTEESAQKALEAHKKFLEWRKTEWATRGPEALAERQKHRALTHNSWRQMRGMELMRNELSYVHNRPFSIGFGVMGAIYLISFFSQSNDFRKESDYWSRYHMKK